MELTEQERELLIQLLTKTQYSGTVEELEQTLVIVKGLLVKVQGDK